MLYRYKYSRWDGTQELFPSTADDLMDAMADDLTADGDLKSALERLLRWGFRGPMGDRLPGLQQLLERLRALRQQQLNRYDLDSTMDDIRQRLERIVQTERAGIDKKMQESRKQEADESLQKALENIAAKKRQFLDNLPQDPGGQIKALADYEFMDPDARQQFQELLQMLQQRIMDNYFQGLQQAIQSMTPEDLQRIRDMVRELNRMLQEKMRGGQPNFQQFMEQYGQYFPGVQNLDELVQSLQRRIAQMQSLLESMTPQMRQQLQDLIDSVLRDEGLRWELAELAANLEHLFPMRQLPQRYPFQGDEPLTLAEAMRLMEQLQDMDRLQKELQRAQEGANLDRIDSEKLRELLGDEAHRDLERLKQLTKILEDAGYIQRRGHTFELTPRGIRRIGQKALRDIFAHLKKDRFGKHQTDYRGPGGERADDSKPYEFGDPFLLDLEKTLMNALEREGPGKPVKIVPGDFEVYRTEYLSQASTVLMVDMSRSMLLRGLFLAAKKVALALHSLIKAQFPKDNLYLLVFAHHARQIKPEMLPQATWDEYMYGTNMQHGFMLARQLLARHKGGTRQIILITDGEPTAHMESGQVYFSYPPTYRTLQETLREVLRCTREQIVINTFMLDRSPYLTSFVDQMAKINRGRAFFASPERLGEYILVDYLANKRQKIS